MGFFGKTQKVDNTSKEISSSTEEKEETRKSKARLLGTEGGNNGSELQANQGKSVRKVFSA